MMLDKRQVIPLLPWYVGRGNKGFVQHHRFKQRIRPRLAHHHIGSSHKGGNFFHIGQHDKVGHGFKAFEQAGVGAGRQDDLQVVLEGTFDQQSVNSVLYTRRSLTATLQEDGKAIRRESHPCEVLLLRILFQ